MLTVSLNKHWTQRSHRVLGLNDDFQLLVSSYWKYIDSIQLLQALNQLLIVKIQTSGRKEVAKCYRILSAFILCQHVYQTYNFNLLLFQFSLNKVIQIAVAFVVTWDSDLKHIVHRKTWTNLEFSSLSVFSSPLVRARWCSKIVVSVKNNLSS